MCMRIGFAPSNLEGAILVFIAITFSSPSEGVNLRAVLVNTRIVNLAPQTLMVMPGLVRQLNAVRIRGGAPRTFAAMVKVVLTPV